MKIIAVADDFGVNLARSCGIVAAARHGLVSHLSAVVNGEVSAPGLAVASRLRGVSTGLHLNLSEGFPVHSATIDSPLCQGGRFLGRDGLFSVLSSDDAFSSRTQAALSLEVLSQLRRFETLYGKPAASIDGHHHAHVFPSLQAVLSDVIRSGEPSAANLRYMRNPTYEPPASGKTSELTDVRRRIAPLADALRHRFPPGIVSSDAFVGYHGIPEPEDMRAIAASGARVVEMMSHVGWIWNAPPQDPYYHCYFSLTDDRVAEVVAIRRLLREVPFELTTIPAALELCDPPRAR